MRDRLPRCLFGIARGCITACVGGRPSIGLPQHSNQTTWGITVTIRSSEMGVSRLQACCLFQEAALWAVVDSRREASEYTCSDTR